MMSRGNFLAPVAMIGGAVFVEVARVRATVVTGRFLARCVRVHSSRRHFDPASRGG